MLPPIFRALDRTSGRRRGAPVRAWLAGRRRRLASAAALGVAAPILGGTPGVLLGLIAVMLLTDAVLPMPGATPGEADERFRRLVRARRAAERRRRLRGGAPERLDLVDDGRGWVAAAERRTLGVQAIPLDSVTGTVEAARARAFDRRLRPDASARPRWTALWLARRAGTALPPVSVYRIGAAHVLRDGHHRASVAAALGDELIEADVIELRPGGCAGCGGRPRAARPARVSGPHARSGR